MKKSERNGILAGIAILIVIVALAWQGGYLTQWGMKPFSYTPPGNSGPDVTDQMRIDYNNGIGKFQLDCSVSDSMDQPTGRVIGTNLNILWYHFVGGTWNFETTINGSGTNEAHYFDASVQDGGYAWAMVEAKSGQAYYVDYAKIVSQSGGYITSYKYVDVDGDGANEFVFQYNLKAHTIPNSGYPILSFKAFLLTYDSGVTMTGDANQTGWAGTTGTDFFENYMTISAEKKGLAIYKVEVILNQTTQTLVRLKSLTIPGQGKVDVSRFSQSFTATDIRWSITFSTTFDGADYVTRPVGDLGKLYFTAEYDHTLTSGAPGNQVLMTINTYYLIAPTEAGSSVSVYNTATYA